MKTGKSRDTSNLGAIQLFNIRGRSILIMFLQSDRRLGFGDSIRFICHSLDTDATQKWGRGMTDER